MERNEKGQFKKGSIPYNKGKLKNIDLDKIKIKYLSGKSTIDLAKEYNVSDKTIASRLKISGVELRKKHTKETANKIRKTMIEKGIQPKERYYGEAWNKGKKLHYKVWNKDKKTGLKSWKNRTFNDDTINKIKQARAKQVFPPKDTKIEIKIKGFLEKLKIEYEQHTYIGEIRHAYQCDFLIPKQDKIEKKIVFECDGCYWHGCQKCNKQLNSKQKKQIAKDNRRNKELIGAGYKIIRIWEHKIKRLKIEEFKNILF